MAQADPARVLQRAWGELRLTELRQLVSETISALTTVDPRLLLGRDLEELELSPIADALEACCAELRDECGMPKSTEQRECQRDLVCRHMADHPTWNGVFREALTKYRELAGQMLERGCRNAPATRIGMAR